MRIVTFAGVGGSPRLGVLDDAGGVVDVWAVLAGNVRAREADRLVGRFGAHWWLAEEGQALLEDLGSGRQPGIRLPLSTLRLLPPVLAPGKILAVGRNYGSHLEEGRRLWADRGRRVERPPFPPGS